MLLLLLWSSAVQSAEMDTVGVIRVLRVVVVWG